MCRHVLTDVHLTYIAMISRWIENAQKQYGIILKPAGSTDLARLLERYCKKEPTNNGSSARHSHKPSLLTVFGCLSQGLVYIHARQMRHKDIKPSNVLYMKGRVQSPAIFLRADSGLG